MHSPVVSDRDGNRGGLWYWSDATYINSRVEISTSVPSSTADPNLAGQVVLVYEGPV
jgi:hypothetical protein